MASGFIFDLVRKNPNFGAQAFSSRGLFSAGFAGSSASIAATSFAFATPFAFRALFGDGTIQVAYCDAGAILDEDINTGWQTAFGNKQFPSSVSEDSTWTGTSFQKNAFGHSVKQYDIQLKPLFSAFHWKNFGLTALRSFLLFYLPLLEPRPRPEDDDDDFLVENPEEQHVDLVEPFNKSVKQIVRETSVSTTRRILERLAVHYISQRMAWKLLKDVPKSAVRKSGRGMPTYTLCFRVCKTTFRGHFLGVLASWLVQVAIDIYGFFSKTTKPAEESDAIVTAEQARVLGKKVVGTTVRCVGSLVFASIGAGIGVALIRPSTGQWIGCVLGDLAGPVIITFCFERLHWEL